MEFTLASAGTWTYFLGSYAYYLPFVLTSVWAPLALFDLSQRKEVTRTKSYIWSFVILLIPMFGGGIYLLSNESTLDKKFRYSAVLGGFGVLILVWILSLVSQI
jgi:hypothetical protein